MARKKSTVKKVWDWLVKPGTPLKSSGARKRRRSSASSARPRASAPSKTSNVERIHQLAAKGGSRTEAEDRELASLIERVRRNPRSEAPFNGARRAILQAQRAVAAQKRAAAKVAAKRNPAPARTESKLLAKAVRQSQAFHGNKGEVYELSAAERKPLPRFVVGIGTLEATEYQPPNSSKRAGVRYRHESGDKGPWQNVSPRRGLLVADPETNRVAIIPQRSSQRFSSKRGIVG